MRRGAGTDLEHEVALCRLLGLGDAYIGKFHPHAMKSGRIRWESLALSADKWEIYQAYFPTRYGFEGGGLEKYNFEQVPLAVLELWINAYKSGDFHSFQIRTTEGQGADAIPSLTGQRDPVLIGFRLVSGRLVPHKLAQWGMDSPERASLGHIAHTVRQMCLQRSKHDL